MPALAPVSVPDEQSEQGCRGLETQSERFCKSLYSCRCGDGLAKYRGESQEVNATQTVQDLAHRGLLSHENRAGDALHF